MAFTMTKKAMKEMSRAQLLMSFEYCVMQLTHETNNVRGVTKATLKSYEMLKNELLDVLESTETYDDDFQIVER